MKIRFNIQPCLILNHSDSFPSHILTVGQFIGYVDIPMLETTIQWFKPLFDAGLAFINLLASTNQTNYKAPICSTVNTRNQILGFGVWEVIDMLLLLHNSLQLLLGPCSLRFVKYCNRLSRNKWFIIMAGEIFGDWDNIITFHFCSLQIEVAVMVNHLYEGLNLAFGLSFCTWFLGG